MSILRRSGPPGELAARGPPGGDLGTDLVQSVRAWFDGLHRRMQRIAQRAVEFVLARIIHATAAHVSRSRTERSAIIAREVWLFTAPRVMPMVEAICASDRSP